MVTNSSNTSIVFGLAAVGLALVVTGVELVRRRAGEAAGAPQDEREAAAGAGDTEQGAGAELPEHRLADNSVPADTSLKKLPLDYFGLVFALTIPFWLFGEDPLPIPVKLPVSALALINPLLAAVILTYRRQGSKGLRELFKKALDFQKITDKAWYLPILFLNPAITVLSYIVMRLAERPLPDPQIPWLMAPVFFLVFFLAGIAEELGWMGYAIDPLQERWGALKASLALGLVWALFHLIPDLQNGQPADWILWQRLGSVALRILMVWIYNNTGKSVFSAIVFHVMANLGWALFPNYGSHYDPFVTGGITLLVAGIVVLGWGPKALARYRFAR